MGADFYNDNYSMSANEAANTANSSSIFTDYSIGKIGTDSKTING